MKIRNRIISVILAATVLYSALLTHSYLNFTTIASKFSDMCEDNIEVGEEHMPETMKSNMQELTLAQKVSAIMTEEENTLLNKLPYKNTMIELSGIALKTANTRSYYNVSNGINITTDGYNVGCYGRTSTDYEVQQMVEFKKYLDSKGIRLLYVSEPTKYIDDAYYEEQFGGESFINRNTDLFLQRISDAGIDYLDLRDNIKEEGIDPSSLFYRTDHHWTVPASLWASKTIAQKLNTDYNYQIELSKYDESNMDTVKYQNCWLGEQGKKVAKSYIGLDDYTMMKPSYETEYEIKDSQGNITAAGDFGIFVNTDVYDLETDPYTMGSWHYSYNNFKYSFICNQRVKEGKALVLGDSYTNSMIPFLSLGIHEVEVIIPRELADDESVRNYVEAGEFDTVIVAYAQFMIGAHDNPQNANYKMFTLD